MHHQAGGWRRVHVSGMFGRVRKYAFKVDYICIDCGYTESFIDDDGLRTVREQGFRESQY